MYVISVDRGGGALELMCLRGAGGGEEVVHERS